MSAATTHEAFVQAVRDVAVAQSVLPDDVKHRLLHAKLLYGKGGVSGARGVTYFSAWKNGEPEPTELIEVCAAEEENWVQLAGTTVHELAHAAAGHGAGHGQGWKGVCAALGLRHAKAAGMVYALGYFTPRLRFALAQLAKPADGAPCLNGAHRRGRGIRLTPFAGRPCSQGIGTRGGKSRGPGSGSRLRKWVCACVPPVIVRAATDTLAAHCDHCLIAGRDAAFKRG